MKPTPTHSTFLLWLHATIVFLNTFTLTGNIVSHKPFLALCNAIVIGCFIMIGMSNVKKFLSYRKEMKAYNIEQKELELKRLEAAFAKELKAQKAKELQEKFSYF